MTMAPYCSSEVADGLERGDVSVHGEHAVGRDHDLGTPGRLRLLSLASRSSMSM